MKILRKIGMALFAVLVSVNFASCSPDNGGESQDDSPSNQPSNEKKLVKMMQYVDGRLDGVCEFKYDSNGRIAEYKSKFWYGGDNPDETKLEYNWYSNDSITVIKNGKLRRGFKLSSGKVIRETDYSREEFYCYAYNEDGNVIEYKELEQDASYNYTWNNGKLRTLDTPSATYSLSYDDNTCKGFFPLFCDYAVIGSTDNLFYVHPEFVGARTIYLPSNITTVDERTSFDYELDSDGYIESCTVVEEECHGGEWYAYKPDTYEFIWE